MQLLEGPWQRPWRALMLPPGQAVLQQGPHLSRGPGPGPASPLGMGASQVPMDPQQSGYKPTSYPLGLYQPSSSRL